MMTFYRYMGVDFAFVFLDFVRFNGDFAVRW